METPPGTGIGRGTGATSTYALGAVAPARTHQADPAPGEAQPAGGTHPAGDTTAEIPVVPRGQRAGWTTGTTRASSYAGVLLPDGTVWHPGSPKRLPAPFALRVIVWVLFLLQLVGLAGLAVEHFHPGWLDFARRSAGDTVVLPGGSTSPNTNTTVLSGGASPRTVPGFHLVADTASGATYVTGASTYSLVITFAHPVWTVVAAPAGSKNLLVEQTLPASASPKTVIIHGTASVVLSAASERIAVVVDGKTVGKIPDPQVELTYTFKPSVS